MFVTSIIVFFVVGLVIGYLVKVKNARRDEIYKMYASFAHDWEKRLDSLYEKRYDLEDTVISASDKDAHTYRDLIVERFNEDIKRIEGYIDHWVSLIPEDRHEDFDIN